MLDKSKDFLYKYLNKKYETNQIKLLAFLPCIAIIIYFSSTFYKGDSLYKEHYKTVTGLDFPRTGEIIYTYSSNKDELGEGFHISIFDIGKKNYSIAHDNILNKGYKQVQNKTNYSKILLSLKPIKVQKEYDLKTQGITKKIAFLNDESSVIIKVILW